MRDKCMHMYMSRTQIDRKKFPQLIYNTLYYISILCIIYYIIYNIYIYYFIYIYIGIHFDIYIYMYVISNYRIQHEILIRFVAYF